MRALHVLLAGFGFLLGFLIIAVSVLIEYFAYIGDANVSIAVSYEAIYTAIATPFVGAVLGWLAALIATHIGWRLSRQTSPLASK